MLNKNKKSSQRRADFDQLPCLHVLNGLESGKIIHIHQQSMSIGLTNNNDIVLQGHGVDNTHARLDLLGGKNITVINCSKDYPTFVNGRSIHQTSMKENDCIQIGEHELKFIYKTFDELSLNEFNSKENMLDVSGLFLKKEFFLHHFQKELEYAQRLGHEVACVMLSISFNVNAVEQDISSCLQLVKKSSRSYDFLGHYKNNTFCLLLKNTALDNALVFANRLLDRFSQQFETRVKINMGISTSRDNQWLDTASIMQNALIYLDQACLRSNMNVVSQRNI